MTHAAPALEMHQDDRTVLERTARAVSLPLREVVRARVLLAAAEGVPNGQIAQRFAVSINTVKRWRSRYETDRLVGFAQVRAGRGRKQTISQERIKQIVWSTMYETPPDQTHWSCRAMAAKFGVSPATVQRVWTAVGVKPHSVNTFKMGADPDFETRLVAVIGLYMAPKERAILLCVDDGTSSANPAQAQIPSSAAYEPRSEVVHECTPKCPFCLFNALSMATGDGINHTPARHRNQEFVQFLNAVETNLPPSLSPHLVMDNCGTYGYTNVQAWLGANPRFVYHVTPTLTGWINLAARCFKELSRRASQTGSPGEVLELDTAISEFLDATSEHPRPFVWWQKDDATCH